MLDQAGIDMAQGYNIAIERIEGVNDNMAYSHYHDFYELYYLESGERYHFYKDELHCLTQGQFILFPPYVMHRSYGQNDTYFKRIVLYFKPSEIISEELSNAVAKSGGVYVVNDKMRREIHTLLKLILDEQRSDTFSNEYIHSILNALLIILLRQAKPQEMSTKHTRIEQIIHYINTNYDKDLSLELLSKEFYISPYHLCHEFKKYTGRTLVEYLNITRIMHAQRKIMETSDSITDICSHTGFKNLTHFNRVFRSITGMSPSKYRKSALNVEDAP